MTTVTIRIFQPIAKSLGLKKIGCWEQEIAIGEGLTLRQALNAVAERSSANILDVIDSPDSDGPRNRVAILFNGRDVVTSRGLDIELTNGDVVAILVPYAGGGDVFETSKVIAIEERPKKHLPSKGKR